MSHGDDAPGAWWPDLDHAVGGVADSIDTTVERAGESVGDFVAGAAGGALAPLADFMLKLVLVVGVVWLVGRAV